MNSKPIYSTVLEKLIKKTKSSVCRYQVGAVVVDRKGKPLAYATNQPRLLKPGGGVHAELAALRKAPKGARVLLVRVGKGGALRPIHPCAHCQRILTKLGIPAEGVW